MTVMDVTELARIIKIPDFQRDKDIEHIEAIYRSIKATLDTGHSPVLPGCLILAQLPAGEQLLVDGNHRLAAMLRLKDCALRVFVNIIQCATMEDAELLFKVTNNNMPMAQLPAAVKVTDVKALLKRYKLQYGKLFSNSKSGSCQRPNIHERGFTEALGKLLEHGCTEEQIIKVIDDYNRELSRRHPKTFRRNSSDTITKMQELMDLCLAKGGFYLGLICIGDYSALLERFNIIEETARPTRLSMPKGLRLQVWDEHFGEARYGKCKVCRSTISVTDFHCAHDIAHKNGGADVVSNLYPCCAVCNLSMADSTLEELGLTHNK